MWRGSRARRRRSTLATSSTPVGYTVAPGPSKCASPSWFPRSGKPTREPLAPCSDSGTGHSNGTGARSAFRGVAAYMDEAVVEAASALQLHGHWSRLKRKPSRWRCRPRPPSRRLAFGCSVRHSAAPRRPVDADPSAAQRGLGMVDLLGMCLPSVRGRRKLVAGGREIWIRGWRKEGAGRDRKSVV